MPRYAAFLRGMNLGGRRVKNDELCAELTAAGFVDVAAFLASGNLAFDADAGSSTELERRVEACLAEGLGYDVPTFVRSAEEVRAIVERGPFAGERGADGGKPQVVFLREEPATAIRKLIASTAGVEDQLVLDGREIHWLPSGSVLDSRIDMTWFQKNVGETTIRTRNTIERFAKKEFPV